MSEQGPKKKTDDPRLLALSTLVMLQAEARAKKDKASLAFLMTNETHRLVNYRQCVYWRFVNGKVKVDTVSGLTALDEHAPYLVWLETIIKQRINNKSQAAVLTIKDINKEDQKDWSEWSAAHAYFAPFKNKKDEIIGGLWIDRKEPFTQGEISLLEQICDSYSYCLRHLLKKGSASLSFSASPIRLFMLGAALALTCFPVRLSVNAPAEVQALNPYVIAPPMDGVIKEVSVSPNQSVKKGDTLFLIDDTDLKNRVEITSKEVGVQQAAFLKASREAFNDISKKAELDLLKAEVATRKAELDYTRALLEKTAIKAQNDGVVIFNDANDLRGMPVRTGQRIMLIANPEDTELQVRVPVDALIDFNKEVPLKLFLNVSPLDEIKAQIKTITYEASPDPDGLITYKIKASFLEGNEPPRVGLKGTAKLYGQRSVLGYQILRRPILSLRRILGL